MKRNTVIGKRGGACLVSLIDKKSRFLLSSKAKKKNSISVKDTMIFCLKGQVRAADASRAVIARNRYFL